MKLAIHNSDFGFHPEWIKYCYENNIPFKSVNCYANDIIYQLSECKALMWHIRQNKSSDIIMAKQLLFALQHKGFKVFPDFYTIWHFDDKLGQKYLFEALKIHSIQTYIFFNKESAIQWVASTSFPKVFKLRGGAGSGNVKLVRTKKEAIKYINIAFGNGFRQYDKYASLKERWRKYKINETDLIDVLKGIIRLGYEPEFSRTIGYERGYIYFQDFIPDCDYDIRVKIIDNKCWAFQRKVRKNDFRASGSGNLIFSKSEIPLEVIKMAFNIQKALKLQSAAFDFLLLKNGEPLLIEISYVFGYDVGENYGYWDDSLYWHEGSFNPFGWMVEQLLS